MVATGARTVAALRLLAAAAMVALACMQAAAQDAVPSLRGVALVIGNSAYEHLPALANPAHDARAVEILLDELGFETSLASDRDARLLSRDLRDFLEDAEGADVAVVYYAGHGIEAGGENFLVPVDADLSALEAAGEKLVPVSAFIEELQATVPVAIVMLDACRDNPFPPGSLVRLEASAQPAPMGTGGLGETRGAARLVPQAAETERYGTVLAFAAEPGRVALDGEPGGNSPYAQAVLRHLDAMAGEEFGMVMRMVAEEVYLKTSGAQRPWVNESLRRLLYFGQAPDPAEGEESELLTERRQLLVTIAALPDPELRRRQVEQIAADGGVPLDAVYGMLRALGADLPQDPAELEQTLRAETERFAKILAQREAVSSPDSEIVRLTTLADEAEREGLLTSADSFRERAKARYLELEPTLEEQEEALDQRFIEGAAVFARSAETKALAFDHLASAHDYAEAFRRVESRDAALALTYKHGELAALTDHGDYKGDNAALERAIEAGGQALRMAEDLGDRESWAMLQNDLGNALWSLGSRDNDTARLEAAIEAFRDGLEERTRERAPLDWAMMQNNLGNVLETLGRRIGDPDMITEAVEAYHAALQESTREREPLDWARTQNNLGNALTALAEYEDGTDTLEEAVEAYRAALQERTRDREPLDWAHTQSNLGNALNALGYRNGDPETITEAVEAYRAALQEGTRERVPLDWAMMQNNLGSALATFGEHQGDADALEEAVEAYRAALLERTRDRVPLDWAQTQFNLANALALIGELEERPEKLEMAVEAYRAALEEGTRERVPLDWASAQNNLAVTFMSLAQLEDGTEMLEGAVEAYRAALTERTRERVPLDWALTQENLGIALVELGERSGRADLVLEGRESFMAVWQFYRDRGDDQEDELLRQRLDEADAALAAME